MKKTTDKAKPGSIIERGKGLVYKVPYTKKKNIVISAPHTETFRHGVHIGFDEDAGEFQGVPDEWKLDVFTGSGNNNDNETRDSNSPILSPTIAPSQTDLDMLRKAQEPRKPVSSAPSSPSGSRNGRTFQRAPPKPTTKDDFTDLTDLDSIRSKVQEKITSKDKARGGLASLIGFYKDDVTAQQRTEHELADLNAEISLLETVLQEIDTGADIHKVKIMLKKLREMEETEGQSVPAGKPQSYHLGIKEGLVGVGSRIVDAKHKAEDKLKREKNDSDDDDSDEELDPDMEKMEREREIRKHETPEETIQRRIRGAGMNLDLQGLDLTQLPNEITRLSQSLTNLNLSFNKISQIPNFFGSLQSLQILILDGNLLQDLDLQIQVMTRLEELYLNGNQLKELSERVSMTCPNLTKLEINNNSLQSLPDELGYLSKLETLKLSGNQLQSLPLSLGYLINLEELDLSCNHINIIPQEFSYMFRLIELNLSSNAITRLPSTFGLLTRLANLNLSDNKLTDFPTSMGLIFGMQGLVASGNTFKDERLNEKLSLSTDQVMDWLEKRMHSRLEGINDTRDYMKKLAGIRPALPTLPALGSITACLLDTDSNTKGQPVGLSPDRSTQTQVKPKPTANIRPSVQSASVHKQNSKDLMSFQEETISAEMQQKVDKLRLLAANLVKTIRTVIKQLKLQLSSVTTLQEGLALAKLCRVLKIEIERIQPGLESETWCRSLRSTPLAQPDEDKMIVLKRTLSITLDNVSMTLVNLTEGIAKTNELSKLLIYVTTLKAFYEHLKNRISVAGN